MQQHVSRNRLHSWMSLKCEVRETTGKGLGVFALEEFTPREIVAVWGGVVVTAEELAHSSVAFPHLKTHSIEIYPSFFLTSTSLTSIDDAERFSHSCTPNVGLKGHLVLLARRRIEIGEELTLDYETISVSGDDSFICKCGSSNCRGKLDGSIVHSPAWQNENRGWISPLIAEQLIANVK